MDERPTDEKAKPSGDKATAAGDESAEKPIVALRGILARAAARDQELQHGLTALAIELLSYLGVEDVTPVWSALTPENGDRVVDEHFVMTPDHWFRGDLQIEIAAGHEATVNLMIREAPKGTHEIALRRELSQSVVIDPPDEKERGEHHQKILERINASLEGQLRRAVSLPAQ